MNSVLRVSSSSSWAPSQGAKAQTQLSTIYCGIIHCSIKGQEPYSGIIPSTALDLFVSYLDRRRGELRLLVVTLLVLFLVLFFVLGVIPIVILGATTLSVA